MQLSNDDTKLFYELYRPLLIYTNKKYGILNGFNSVESFKKFTMRKVNKVRIQLYKHPGLFNSFVKENPLNFSADKLKIISNWENFVQGGFFIFRYLKDYAIFLESHEPPKAYGVLALYTSFIDMVGPSLPIIVETTLLPFKDKIIYDGIIVNQSIHFGGGIKKSLNDAYQKSKSVYGIITSLPFKLDEVEQIDAKKLKYYLKNKNNREEYSEEIDELITKNSDLLTLYHQEMGRIYSGKYGKRLHEIVFNKTWFAIFDDIIIASGTTKADVEQVLQSILPEEKRKFVYIFQVKRR